MSVSDFELGKYKALSYLYECIREGVEPNDAMAQEVTKLNPVFWRAVENDLVRNELVTAVEVKTLKETLYGNLQITSAGVAYLEENPGARKAREFLGAAFETALKVAVEATRYL